MTQEAFIEAMAQAIAAQEGFYSAGSLAQRNHNPGNLRAVGGGAYRVYANDAEGWAASKWQIARNLARDTAAMPLSMFQFFAGQRDDAGAVLPGGYPGWAPSADRNNPLRYAQFVGGRLGIADLNAPLSSFFDGGTSDQPGDVPPEMTPVNLSDIATGIAESSGVPVALIYGAAAVVGWLAVKTFL